MLSNTGQYWKALHVNVLLLRNVLQSPLRQIFITRSNDDESTPFMDLRISISNCASPKYAVICENLVKSYIWNQVQKETMLQSARNCLTIYQETCKQTSTKTWKTSIIEKVKRITFLIIFLKMLSNFLLSILNNEAEQTLLMFIMRM